MGTLGHSQLDQELLDRITQIKTASALATASLYGASADRVVETLDRMGKTIARKAHPEDQWVFSDSLLCEIHDARHQLAQAIEASHSHGPAEDLQGSFHEYVSALHIVNPDRWEHFARMLARLCPLESIEEWPLLCGVLELVFLGWWGFKYGSLCGSGGAAEAIEQIDRDVAGMIARRPGLMDKVSEAFGETYRLYLDLAASPAASWSVEQLLDRLRDASGSVILAGREELQLALVREMWGSHFTILDCKKDLRHIIELLEARALGRRYSERLLLTQFDQLEWTLQRALRDWARESGARESCWLIGLVRNQDALTAMDPGTYSRFDVIDLGSLLPPSVGGREDASGLAKLQGDIQVGSYGWYNDLYVVAVVRALSVRE